MSSAYDIQGRNCVFQLLIGDEYMDVVCAKTFSINPVTDMKETTTTQSGFWKEFRPRKLSYTISFNGAVQTVAENDKPTIKSMMLNQFQFLPMSYRLLYYDNSNNIMVITGEVYVTSSLIDANPINLLNGTTEMQGNGPIEILDSLPETINIHISSTGDGSIGALFQFKLINTGGEIIFDSGQLPEASGGNLSHPVDATGQVDAGNYYFLWQATTDSDLNNFSLDAPPTKSTDFIDGTQSENSFPTQIYDFTANRNVVFALGIPLPPPACVSPVIPGSPALPDGTQGVPYSYLFAITGTEPFTTSNITKPLWLSIGIINIPDGSGDHWFASFSGTPGAGDVGAGIVVSFDIENGCGTVSFSDTITVIANDNIINVGYTFSNGGIGFGTFRIYVNGGFPVVALSASGSGTHTVVPGDVVQISVTKVGSTKHIVVNDSVSGDLFNVTNGNTSNTFSWTALAGHDYTITATIS